MQTISPPITSQQQTVDAGSQLIAWVMTEEGTRTWARVCACFSPYRIAQALRNTQATSYGLLLCAKGAIIWSTFSEDQFARLHDHYQQAIRSGLCFWWNGEQLVQVSREQFCVLLRNLPCPASRHLILNRQM